VILERERPPHVRIASAATAFPAHYYPQEHLAAALKQHWGHRLDNVAVLDRLHERLAIDGRYLALPVEAYASLTTWGAANDAWMAAAEDLGADAVNAALTRAGRSAKDVDALLFASVTGIASPSIDARLVPRAGFRTNVRRLPVFGLGCVAGAAGLARAADYVRAYPDRIAVLVCVELCSLTWQRDDVSVANLIATGLFGDGAAAVVVTGREVDTEGPEIVATESVFYPGTLDAMGWRISEDGFRIVLSPEVPDIVRTHLGHDVDRFLAEQGLDRAAIDSWIIHPGGPKILRAAEAALELPREALALSWDCLRRVGNFSSGSVLMVLEAVMERRRPSPGAWSVLAAMGPGFCAELVLLRW
jgi:alkylresorcinol/alkylpyrone synthase